jgi:hypothetical protein
MHRRDEELLDRQLKHMNPPRNDSLLGVMVAMVFLVGFALGGLLFAHPHGRGPSVASGELAAISLPSGGTNVIR